MPITTEQLLTLYQLARDQWLGAHAILCAYERDYRRNKNVSEWIQRGTCLSAIATALAAAFVSTDSKLAAIPGILTAVLAGFEQLYAPAKKMQTFWDCRTQLDSIKKDLVKTAIAMENVADLAAGMELLNQIDQRLKNEAKVPYEVLQSDHDAAQRAFIGSVLAGMISRYEQAADHDEEKPQALGFDAPGIVIASRQLSPAL
jgi:hypothetical protein